MQIDVRLRFLDLHLLDLSVLLEEVDDILLLESIGQFIHEQISVLISAFRFFPLISSHFLVLFIECRDHEPVRWELFHSSIIPGLNA